MVITHLLLSGDGFGSRAEVDAVFKVEECIEPAVDDLGGTHDGNEFGGGEAVLYTYGPDADELLIAIRACLESFDTRRGSYALKRYGEVEDLDAREVRVDL